MTETEGRQEEENKTKGIVSVLFIFRKENLRSYQRYGGLNIT
jgi:hypothetical protein